MLFQCCTLFSCTRYRSWAAQGEGRCGTAVWVGCNQQLPLQCGGGQVGAAQGAITQRSTRLSSWLKT